MGIINKYFMVVESDQPPQVFLNETIPKIGKVIELKTEQLPNRVDAAWLQERFSISRKALIEKLRIFNHWISSGKINGSASNQSRFKKTNGATVH